MAGKAPKDDATQSSATWKRLPAAIVLVALGLLHAVAPTLLTLDWPTVGMICAGLFLIFVPVEKIGDVIQSLEIGNTKILFRQVKALNKSVGIAEAEEAEQAPKMLQASAATPAPSYSFEKLLSVDKEMALIGISLEIEKQLAALAQKSGTISPTFAANWHQATTTLVQRQVITPATASALTEFRQVRNQLIHPVSGVPPEAVVASAIDSGIKLLQLLSAL